MNSARPVMAISVLVFIAILIASNFYPEQFWAIHFIHLFETKAKVLLWALAGAFMVGGFFIPTRQQKFTALDSGLLRSVVPLLVGLATLLLPIAFDDYGDARFIREGVDITIPEWNWRLLFEPLNPDFRNTKAGLLSYYELNNFFTWLFGVNGTLVTPYLQAILACVLAFTWIRLVTAVIKDAIVRWAFIIVLLTAPLMMVFMSHYETYFLSYAATIVWFAILWKVFQGKSPNWLYALTAFFPVLLQTHIINWLFLPSLVIAWAFVKPDSLIGKLKAQVDDLLTKTHRGFKGGMSWSAMLYQFILPAFALLLVAYFFIWENHNGPRQFSKDEFEDTLFLPLFTDEPAPYDRYNLFSANHLTDRFNLMLMWSPALLLLIVPCLTFLRKTIDWKNPLVVLSGSTFIVFWVVFFLLNPLLGPTEDWDLFMAPGLVLFPTVLFAYGTIKEPIPIGPIIGPALAMAVLVGSFHIVNATPNLLAEHYRVIGSRKFKTYWIGSSTTIITSAEMRETEANGISALEKEIELLRPFATEGHDKEYANLLSELGMWYKNNGETLQALALFEEAHTYSPNLGTNLYRLCVAQFELEQFEAARSTVEQLVNLKYQPYERTLRMAVHISLAAKNYQRAADFAVTYLNRYSDPAITEVEQRLRTGQNIESLIELFGGE